MRSSLESLAASRASQEIRIKAMGAMAGGCEPKPRAQELQQQVAEGQGALEKAKQNAAFRAGCHR